LNHKAEFVWIKDKFAYLIPIGDIHLGDSSFSDEAETKLRGYIKWIRSKSNARVILMGDVFNVATRTSVTSPFQKLSLKEEMECALEIFKPIKDKIIGAIDGNHEQRATDFLNYSPLIPFCHILGTKYFQYSAVFKFGVGVTNKGTTGKPRTAPKVMYLIFAHHTTGGGSTVGGRINRVDKLRQILINADIYLGAHNHALINAPVEGFICDKMSGNITRHRQHIIDCGSYLDWQGSYAEMKMYPPQKLGSPRIRLDGSRKDVHVSL